MNSPLISVIIPCHDDGKYLLECVSSVQKLLTLEGIDPESVELIVVDDGSADPQTAAVLDELDRDGVVVLRDRNRGPAAARNLGISRAIAPIILPLDADNRLLAPYLTDGLRLLLSDPTIDVVYGDLRYIGLQSSRKSVGEFDLIKLLMGNYIDTCALFRKSLWSELGGYDERIRLGLEDWDFWLRAAVRSRKFSYLPMDCFEYRVRTNSLTSCSLDTQSVDRDYIFAKEELKVFAELRAGVIRNNETFRNSYSFRIGNFFVRRLLWLERFGLGASR